MIQCSSRKVRFPSKEMAEEAAQVLANSLRKKLRVYQCPKCRGWHRSSKYGKAREWIRPSKEARK